MRKGALHVATLDHRTPAIEDQVWFLRDYCREHNIEFSVDLQPRLGVMNAILEGVTLGTSEALRRLKRSRGFVGTLVVTENWEWEPGLGWLLNGNPCDGTLGRNNDPMISPSARLMQLIALAQSCGYVVGLGQQPMVSHMRHLFVTHWLGNIDTRISFGHSSSTDTATFDLFFSVPDAGILTPYRQESLASLASLGVSVDVGVGVQMDEWIQRARRSRAVLDIPRHPSWRWPSPMRVLRAHRAGRPLLSLRTHIGSYGVESSGVIPLNSASEVARFLKLNNQLLPPAYVVAETHHEDSSLTFARLLEWSCARS